jgi:phosphatidylglycerophosphatase A
MDNTENTTAVRPDPRLTLHFIATGFGSGLLPRMPGTWGSLAALPFGLALLALPTIWMAVVIALATVVGIWICDKVSQDMGVHDHDAIVLDEFVGMWIAMLFLPAEHTLLWALVAFVAFRLFDVWKPGFIGHIDRTMKGGKGIMLDDVLAGFAALFVVQSLVFLASFFGV